MKRILLAVLAWCVFAPAGIAAGRVECNSIRSKVLAQPVRYCALLPPSYDADKARRYPVLYSITYLGLQAEVAGIDISEVIARVQPNYALARCDVLRNTKIGYQHQRGPLCCQSFPEAGAGR